MKPEYWKNKWKNGDTLFHRDKPHPELLKHFSKISPRKVMVPLCGKSNDLLWLRSAGHEVVGIELSSLACEAFISENGLSFQKYESDQFVKYVGDRIVLWCGDFFEIPLSAWEGCSGLYDRAALVALPKDLRKKYANHILQSWVDRKSTTSLMLLISVAYSSQEHLGPPFSVDDAEIQALFGKAFKVEKLDSGRDEALSNRPPKFTSIEVTESSYRLTSV